ncbi:hypothetical protein GCM10020001_070980 [Nonomuraea salmonea]
MIRVGVLGAQGRVGVEVCKAVEAAADMELVAALDKDDSIEGLAGAEVVVDFTHPDVVMGNLEWAIGHGVHPVVGTTGFDEGRLETVRGWLAANPGTNCLIAPQLRHRGRAHDALRAAGRPLLRVGRDRRAAPPQQGRRAVRHGPAHC